MHQSNKPVRVCDSCFTQKTDHLNRFRPNSAADPGLESPFTDKSSSRGSIHEELAACVIEEERNESFVNSSGDHENEKTAISKEEDNEKELNNSHEHSLNGGHQSEDMTSDSEDDLDGENLKSEEIPAEVSQVSFLVRHRFFLFNLN